MTFPPSLMPRGRGILLGRQQPLPIELNGKLDWGAAYMGGLLDQQIGQLRAAGAKDVFVWAEPPAWTVLNYQARIDQAEHLCRQYSLPGYIVDVETVMSDAQAVAFGSALKDSVQRGFSVGLTGFAGYRPLAAIADGCDGTVWTLCQIYNQGSNEARVFQQWLDRFTNLFGRAMPLIPTYVPVRGHGAELATLAGYDAFLAKVPPSDAVGCFGTTHWMLARYATFRGASIVTSALWLFGLPTIAHEWTLATLFLTLALVGAFLLFFYFRKAG